MHPNQHQQQYELFLTLLRDARSQAGLTQQDLADRIGWTQSFVSKCERGERRIDVIDLLAYLGEIGVSPGDFVGGLAIALEEAAAGQGFLVTSGSKTPRRTSRAAK